MVWVCVAPMAALHADLPERPEDWLTHSEAARHQDFALPARRLRYLAGRWLLRRLLAAAADECRRPALEIDVEGRSHSPMLPDWRISLSHSGDWFAAAVAKGGALGVDIERPRAGRDLQALALNLGLEDASAPVFYRHWTLSEAWLKQGPGPGLLVAQRRLRWRPHDQGSGRCWSEAEHALHLALWAPAATAVVFWPFPGAASLNWCAQGRWQAISDDPLLNQSFKHESPR